MELYRINYKSDFLLDIHSDAGWATPFCIKFWTGAPSQAYIAGWDGTAFTHCTIDQADPTKLHVQFDDHHLPVGNLKFQVGYHFTVSDFPTSVEDEVINQTAVIVNANGTPMQVMLDFNGETAPELEFNLPAYANEQQRMENEVARQANERARDTNETHRVQNENRRIAQEGKRQETFEQLEEDMARLKEDAQVAITGANTAATTANNAADHASEMAEQARWKSIMAETAASMANTKAALAQEKANLAGQAAALADANADIAHRMADFATEQGNFAKSQGEYAKQEGDAIHTLNATMTEQEAVRKQNEQGREAAEQQRQATFEQAEAERETSFEAAERRRDATVDAKVADITNLQTRMSNAEEAVAGKQNIIVDLATISLGSGVSHDVSSATERTVTIDNFILLKNGTIDVLFTTPVNASDTTLNVSNTGAKPLRILGQSLPAGVVKARTYATLVYDGTAWNIVNLFCPGAEYDPAGQLVDMGLPSGVKWAARDIDLTKPGGFCDSPFTYMKSFFSWGNIDGHNPISVSAFDYNWGGTNQAEPWYEGQPYGSTPGNTLTGNIAVGEDFDAARANLGEPWRMPTDKEFGELFANIIYIDANGDEVDTTKTDKRVSVNGVMGLYIQSKLNSARLFFSSSGLGIGRSWYYRGSNGYYWSSAWSSARDARTLVFFSGGVSPQNNSNRYGGFAVRPVQ